MEYKNYFRGTRMPKDFNRFADKAIEIAGKAGERKRQHALASGRNLAESRMAELERTQAGADRRQAMVEAGKETRHEREYGQGGVRNIELADKEAQDLRRYGPEGTERRKMDMMYGPESYPAIESGRRFGPRGLEVKKLEMAYGPESYPAIESKRRFGPGGFEDLRLRQQQLEAGREIVGMPMFDEAGQYTGATTPGMANLETGEVRKFKKAEGKTRRPLSKMTTEELIQMRKDLGR